MVTPPQKKKKKKKKERKKRSIILSHVSYQLRLGPRRRIIFLIGLLFGKKVFQDHLRPIVGLVK